MLNIILCAEHRWRSSIPTTDMCVIITTNDSLALIAINILMCVSCSAPNNWAKTMIHNKIFWNHYMQGCGS